MLRDAVILLRPIEVRKLIEIGANINCNQFPQVKRLNHIQTVFYWDYTNQGSPSDYDGPFLLMGHLSCLEDSNISLV